MTNRRSTGRYSLDDTMDADSDNDSDSDDNSNSDSNSNKDDNVDVDASAKAYAAIQAQLASFTSSKLGTVDLVPTSNEQEGDFYDTNRYGMDAVQWMRQELDSDDEPMEDTAPVPDSMPSPSPNSRPDRLIATPQKAPILQRANTPVMSNSSKKKRSSESRTSDSRQASRSFSSSSRLPDTADDDAPDPVRTPVRQTHAPPARNVPDRPTLEQTQQTLFQKQYDRRYHDALLSYLKDRRLLSDRMALAQQEQALDLHATTSGTGVNDTNNDNDSSGSFQKTSYQVARDERNMDINFLRKLQALAWGNATSNLSFPLDDARLEGNAWMLLSRLRSLDMTAILWCDDPASSYQHRITITGFLEQTARQEDVMDKQLLCRLLDDRHQIRPLALRRQHELLQWIQDCFAPLCTSPPPRTTKDDQQDGIPDEIASLIAEGSPCIDGPLLASCLNHIMANKLSTAQQIARDYGQPWRAAILEGGQPYGYRTRVSGPDDHSGIVADNNGSTAVVVGNEHRFVWKQAAWKNSVLSLKNRPEESAIYSFLANDVKTSLANPLLRTWEHGLSAVLHSKWGRMEDQVLHWNHNHRRERFPHLAHEKTQLTNTSDLEELTELEVIQMLASSPFQEMQGRDEYHRAMSAILIGKEAMIGYAKAMSEVCESFDVELLRFVTHMMLYLDSLSVCTTPMSFEGIEDCKNIIVFEYVQYLAGQPLLWDLLTLYVSFLPEHMVLDFFPQLLSEVVEDKRRRVLLEQTRDLFATPGMDLLLARQVVRILLEQDQYDGGDTETDQRMNDISKSRSIKWLLQYDEHYGDALVCANILLRDFFSHSDDNKIQSASVFVYQYLPGNLLEKAGAAVPDSSVIESVEVYHQKIEYAKREYLAFLSYLEAYALFGEWKDVITSKVIGGSSGSKMKHSTASMIDPDRMGLMERKMIRQMEIREWVKSVTADCNNIIEAGCKALEALFTVLSLPGGWLSIDDEPLFEGDEEEQEKRRTQIGNIRDRYIVLAVNLYLQVCQETAVWMSRLLDDAVPSKFATRQEALQQDKASPIFWYQTALDIAETVASDKYEIYKSFKDVEMEEFLSSMAEISVSRSMEKV